MVDVFISYSRNDKEAVTQLAQKIEAEGYDVWWDAELPPHKSYGEVITGKLEEAKAAIVVWSPDAAKSEWVRAEADMARNYKKLVQTALGDIIPPLPFNQIQFADIGDWQGDDDHAGWRKVMVSLHDLCGAPEQNEASAEPDVKAAEPAKPPSQPDPKPEPDQSSAAPPPIAPPSTPQTAPSTTQRASPWEGESGSSSKWPVYAGLGCAGFAVLAVLAIAVGAMSSDDTPTQDAPIALADPTFGDTNSGQSNPDMANIPTQSTQSQSFSGALNNSQSNTHDITLNAGTSYLIVAQCDQDCSDIDMRIFDENANLIDEDVLEDAAPVLQVTPARTATFTIQIDMFACSIAPCRYDIAVEGS